MPRPHPVGGRPVPAATLEPAEGLHVVVDAGDHPDRDVAIAGLLTVLEPALICFLGVVVGGIVISMYMPLFDLISQLS